MKSGTGSIVPLHLFALEPVFLQFYLSWGNNELPELNGPSYSILHSMSRQEDHPFKAYK